MAEEKYIRESGGSIRSVTTPNLQLEKPFKSDNYNIDVFNGNADKIESAFSELKCQVDGLELTSDKVTRPNGKTVEASLSSLETELGINVQGLIKTNNNIVDLLV